jgi:THO complex subunit 1
MCSPTTSIFIINDILSAFTLDESSEIFSYLEDNANVWKSELFFSSVKNYLLRMCNDLLKRLSKSQNTVFSGRIHLFLAKLFPLNERSGLNLMSHFSENVTRYTTTAEIFEEALNKNKSVDKMESNDEVTSNGHKDRSTIPVDYNLYRKFWSLQDFFNKPNVLYERVHWKLFTNNANDVFEALKSYKLDDVKTNKKSTLEKLDDMQVYFAKYLTSAKLLDLQLNDSNFRRQTLVQFLILFQYLQTEVRFKTPAQVLSEEQVAWIKAATSRVYQLLKETPPNGDKFSQDVKRILSREDIWNKWKNEGCPNFVRDKKDEPTRKAQKRARPTTSDFDRNKQPKYQFDNTEIGKLCNVNHDNLAACHDPSRQFLPSLKDFFEEAIDQLDPANQVEKEYHLVHDADWSWRALRLLAKRSALYFTQNQNVKTISEYLETICIRLGKELPLNEPQQNDTESTTETENEQEDDAVQIVDENTGAAQGTSTNGKSSLSREERIKQLKAEFQMDDFNEDSQSSTQSDSGSLTPKTNFENLVKKSNQLIINSKTIDALSERITKKEDWKNLAIKLNMDDDTISFIESDSNDCTVQCKRILLLWKEREEKQATIDVLYDALNKCDLSEIINKLDSNDVNSTVIGDDEDVKMIQD